MYCTLLYGYRLVCLMIIIVEYFQLLFTRNTIQLSMISTLLGHCNTSITERVHNEYKQEAKFEVVNTLNFTFNLLTK